MSMLGLNLHFIPEPVSGTHQVPSALVAPCGPSFLSWTPEAGFVLSPAKPTAWGGSVLLEPVERDGQLRGLLLNASGADLRVNGQAVGAVALVAAGDVIRLAEAPALEVAVHRDPWIGQATGEALTLTLRCPVCDRSPTEGERVFRCVCSTLYHLAEEGTEGFRCATAVSRCRVCLRELVFEPGYLAQPQWMSHETAP